MDPEPTVIEIEIPGDIPLDTRIDTYIADFLKLFSRSQVKRRVTGLRVNTKSVKTSKHLLPGDRLEITYTAAPEMNIEAQTIDLSILYEDGNVLVVDKPQGMVVHPAGGNWSGTLANAILGHSGGIRNNFPSGELRPGIVHRLDKDTSGVIITARMPRRRSFWANSSGDAP